MMEWIILALVGIIFVLIIIIGFKVYKGKKNKRDRANFAMKYADEENSDEEEDDESQESSTNIWTQNKSRRKSNHALNNDHSKGIDNDRIKKALMLAVDSRKN